MDGDIDPFPLSPVQQLEPVEAHPLLRALIVEDDPFLAADAHDILERAGFFVAGVATNLAEARALLDRGAPDVAVVDLNLADGPTGSRAAIMVAETGCAVVMATGQPRDVPPGTPAFAILAKPYLPQTLVRALREAAGARRLPPARR